MKIKNSIFFINLLIKNFIIIIMVLILNIFVSYRIIKSNYISNLIKDITNDTLIVEELIKEDFIADNIKEMNLKIKSISKKINYRITIIRLDGSVIADSEENYKNMDNHKNRKEIIDALANKIGVSQRFSNTLKNKMLYIANPIKNNKDIIGACRVSTLIKDIKIFDIGYRINFLLSFLVLFIFSIFFAFFMTRRLNLSIKELSDASKRIAGGNFNIRLYLSKKGEFAELSNNFNIMIERLSYLFNELNNKNEELESIITSINEGIIVIDNQGKIIKVNKSFMDLINRYDIINKYYWEVVRESEIIEFIKNKDNNINNIIKQINYFDKILLCSINYLNSNQGFVLIFHDITQLKNLENIKRDFISNVSHELRTPLTAIKGFAETILDDETNQDKINYLNIIYRNTQRLINIVNDLLLLSKLEKSSDIGVINKLNHEKVNLVVLIKNILSIFEERIKEKKLELKFDFIDNTEVLEGDAFNLEQMFINLIDNSIKYTDEGEIKIILSNCEDMNKIKIEIIDTGIGIPEKDLPRLFERFYVVDKSRSKTNGGTGLGLSIVKHIVMLHNGEIKVSSRINEGTKIVILLPKK